APRTREPWSPPVIVSLRTAPPPSRRSGSGRPRRDREDTGARRRGCRTRGRRGAGGRARPVGAAGAGGGRSPRRGSRARRRTAGRASCRERVERWGGAGGLKKKSEV